MSWQQRRIYKCEAGILAVILPFSIICLLAFSGPLLSACSDDDEGKYLELEALGQCIPPPSHVYTCVAIRIRIRKRICIRIRDPDRHQNLIICSLAHCQSSLKISCKSVRKFLRNVDNRQTDRQTDNDDYITSWAEVTTEQQLLFRMWGLNLCGPVRPNSVNSPIYPSVCWFN